MLLLLLSTVTCLSLHNQSSITVFGDSWSDAGNGSYVLSNGTWPLPTYYNHRFSNGPIWVDALANLAPGIQVQSYAVGGATVNSSVIRGFTGAKGNLPSPSVTEQIDLYMANHKVEGTEKKEYIIWAGGNDYFFGADSPKLIAENLVSNAERLTRLGSVVIINLPPLQKLPYLSSSGPLAYKFEQLTGWHNGNLSILLATHKKISLLNIHDEWNALIGGFTRATSACLNAIPCSYPSSYVFWDQFHFTYLFHKRIAQFVYSKWQENAGYKVK